MTSTLLHLNSVASARMTEVLPLSRTSFSSRQVVCFLNIPCSKLNQYHRINIRCSSRISPLQSPPITMLPTTKKLSCCSYTCFTTLEELEEREEDYNKRNSNIANSRTPSYDRMSASVTLSSSSSVLSSRPDSCSCNCNCNCQNARPFIQINIVFPVFQFWHMLTRVYSYLDLLLDRLIMGQFTPRGGGTLFYFQVAVLDKERALRRKLNKIAKNGVVSTRDGPNYILKGVVKALLEDGGFSIHFAHLHRNFDSMESLSRKFEDILNRELERYGDDENMLVNVDDSVELKNKASTVKANSSIENEYTVVTLLVLASGRYFISTAEREKARENDSNKVLRKEGGRCADCCAVLHTLQCIPRNEIQSVEVLWSPREEEKVLLEDELVKDFPSLIRIHKGLLYGFVS